MHQQFNISPEEGERATRSHYFMLLTFACMFSGGR